MHAALTALTDELKRLKARGVEKVVVSGESLESLRKVIEARNRRDSPTPVAATPGGATAAPAAREYSQLRQRAPAPPPPPKLPPPPVVTLPAGDKKTRWEALFNLVTRDPECLKHVRPEKKVVLGAGNLDARIFFCGEAPGAEEEKRGEPFVGPAGELLTKMIIGMGLRREDVYIGNIMNWRPELPAGAGFAQIGNRPPTEEEMLYCLPYLRAQLEIIQPQIIVALGATAAKGLLGFSSVKTLGAVRNRWHDFEGKPLMVTYHPSFLLHTTTAEAMRKAKRAVWEDLLLVMERAGLPVSEKQRRYYLAQGPAR